MTDHADSVINASEDLAILHTMRDVIQIVLRSETREELERAVCEAFAATELYVFAWIGVEDPATGLVVPRASAGVEEGYLSSIEIPLDDPDPGPTAAAVQTHEFQVIQNIQEDPAYEAWRDEALKRGFRSSAAVPLVYDGELHGVLNLYAPRSNAFDTDERDHLAEVGRDIGFAIDVMETRAALDRSRDFLARTEELASTGGWEYDPSTDDFRWTPGARRLHGVESEGPASLEAALADYRPEDREALEAAIDAAVTEHESFDLTLRMAGGDPRWIRVLGRPQTETTGEPVVRGVLQDMTDRKAYEERLAVRNEQLLVLNRIVRHDIRNDMTIALGWGSELAAHVDVDGVEMLDRVLDTCEHVVDVTHALRDFIQTLESGASQAEPIELGEILAEEIQKRRSAYPEAAFAVNGSIADTWVYADELLSSVFRNVLDNAVIHNDAADPRVEVTIERGEETVQVRVADNGPGIAPERRDAVLGRTAAGLDHPESGLGLYLVDSLVDSYGGEVRIEDNDPSGAVFAIELRRAPAAVVEGRDDDRR